MSFLSDPLLESEAGKSDLFKADFKDFKFDSGHLVFFCSMCCFLKLWFFERGVLFGKLESNPLTPSFSGEEQRRWALSWLNLVWNIMTLLILGRF